jgi:glycerate dehydrogenase
MKIVYLDAHTVNPEEIDLNIFKTFGDFQWFDRTLPEQVVERAKEATILFTNKVKLDSAILKQLPHLKYIGVTATGYNVVDIVAAKELGITVTNAKNYSSNSVAQQVFAMILAFSNRLAEHDNPQKWVKNPDFCYFDYSLMELKDKTLGLIGYGDIGKKVAQIALAFEMKVLVHKKTPFGAVPENISEVNLETILSESDFLSLHCPLTSDNEGFINAESLSKMKASAVLINTARGPLVNETELADALNTGKIAGAYLDVLSVEPPTNDNPLLAAKNCKISPHIAWGTREARQRLIDIVYQNLANFLAGIPSNVVN